MSTYAARLALRQTLRADPFTQGEAAALAWAGRTWLGPAPQPPCVLAAADASAWLSGFATQLRLLDDLAWS
jgi:hypothetical protein